MPLDPRVEAYLASIEAFGKLELQIGIAPEEGAQLKKELPYMRERRKRHPGLYHPTLAEVVVTVELGRAAGALGPAIPPRPAMSTSGRNPDMVIELVTMLDTFRRAYAAHGPLSEAEIAAIARPHAQACGDLLSRKYLEFETPQNAPLTVELKGFSDPWVATGETASSVSACVFIGGERKSKDRTTWTGPIVSPRVDHAKTGEAPKQGARRKKRR